MAVILSPPTVARFMYPVLRSIIMPGFFIMLWLTEAEFLSSVILSTCYPPFGLRLDIDAEPSISLPSRTSRFLTPYC